MMRVNQFQAKYYNLMILVQLPFFALGTYWVFKKQRLYFAEHLTLQTFLIAQTAVFGIIMMLLISLFKIDTGFMLISMSIISIIYQIMAFYQFFGKQQAFVIFKGLLSYLLGFILYILFYVIVLVAVAVVMVAKKAG